MGDFFCAFSYLDSFRRRNLFGLGTMMPRACRCGRPNSHHRAELLDLIGACCKSMSSPTGCKTQKYIRNRTPVSPAHDRLDNQWLGPFACGKLHSLFLAASRGPLWPEWQRRAANPRLSRGDLLRARHAEWGKHLKRSGHFPRLRPDPASGNRDGRQQKADPDRVQRSERRFREVISDRDDKIRQPQFPFLGVPAERRNDRAVPSNQYDPKQYDPQPTQAQE